MDGSSQWVLLIISLIANIFSAFIGSGAGLIQLPALIFLGLTFSVVALAAIKSPVLHSTGALHWASALCFAT